jgi:hypothetical protein
MSRAAELAPGSPRPDSDRHDDVSAIVGPSILGSADVARAGERRRMGATTLAISADKIIWNFFESHPLGP